MSIYIFILHTFNEAIYLVILHTFDKKNKMSGGGVCRRQQLYIDSSPARAEFDKRLTITTSLCVGATLSQRNPSHRVDRWPATAGPGYQRQGI